MALLPALGIGERDLTGGPPATPEVASIRLALLKNFIAPYSIPVFRELHARLREFRVFVSTAMETDRGWEPDSGRLAVTVQRTLTVMSRREHPHGFADRLALHVPYDTLWRLHGMSPDVVISGELGWRTLQAVAYRRWLTLRGRAKLIIWTTLSETTELARGRARRLLRAYLLSRADAVLVNGASAYRYVRSFDVPEPRIFTVPYTTDLTPFQALPLNRAPESSKRLLYVGRLIQLKALDRFITALCRWAERHPDRRAELWLVGDGPVRSELEQIARPANLRLRFIGNVPYGELVTWYGQAGILAFPTLADEWGVVVNEALAAGVPVLGSVFSGAVEELVRDGHNGWTFRSDRTEELASALDRALNTPDVVLESMRVRARQSVSYLTPAFAADQFLKAVRFVLTEP
ncbi:MAG TPA: glycosyltransferase family 4 protein [Gemmatimonadaceae bacterium]